MDHSPAPLPWLEISIILLPILFLFAAFKVTVLHDDDKEKAVHFRVPTPEQCSSDWKGELLERPTVKVASLLDMAVKKLIRVIQFSGSSAIRCYCPANGRLLGLVNPSTPGGIDRAVAKAKEAQTEWAKTTYKQRRRVLKTMLKYVQAFSKDI